MVDEDHTDPLERFHHPLVVHDLVVAVDGPVEDAHHPREGLDRHLDACAEPARLGHQHSINHAREATDLTDFPVLAEVSLADARVGRSGC